MRIAVSLLLAALPIIGAENAQSDAFEMRVRPLFAKNCVACHGPSRMGGLDLTSREGFLKGGNSGPIIDRANPDHSLLLKVLKHEHERIKMPPTGKLADSELDAIARWVRDGAEWPQAKTAEPVIAAEHRAFWSFQPVKKPAAPGVRNPQWARTPIDKFVLAKLEEKNIKPAPPAEKRALIRRATYDLTGLPPTIDEVDAFIRDTSLDAFAKVIDRLLASPRYGERWGRHWLDVARYSDDKLHPERDDPHPNAFQYRDWVIRAFNDDLPFDQFVKAQIAGDLMPNPDKMAGGLGLYALSPEFQDDRVDVTTRGFLGLTVACAQCHDHKFDPIPQKDYYALLGVFSNTKAGEYPLASKDVVDEYKKRKKAVEDQEKAIKEFVSNQADQLARILAFRTADYLMAAWTESDTHGVDESLDPETLKRWANYLAQRRKDHPYLASCQPADHATMRACAEDFQRLVLDVFDEKKKVDQENLVRLGGSNERRNLANADLVSLPRDKYFLWRDMFAEKRGVFHYGETAISRWLHGEWKTHLAALQDELEKRKKAVPEQYAFYQVIEEVEKPTVQKLFIRGDRNNPGEPVPSRFLTILQDVAPKPFTQARARLELAEAIANPKNPLTARVMVNRIWQAHFGQGIVRTPSNFGQLGDRPSHPELLDYLAARFVENGLSIKAMHREIMLSAVYQLGSGQNAKASAIDADNRLLWRAPLRRLDAESLRDSLLFVAGTLDPSEGGKPQKLDETNRRRAVYGYVSRRKLDPMLAIFDFPNPNNTSEQRVATNVPLQALFLLNSPIVIAQAEALASRLPASNDAAKVREAYRRIFGRNASAAEVRLGLEFIRSTPEKPWAKFLQVLLTSNEFLYLS